MALLLAAYVTAPWGSTGATWCLYVGSTVQAMLAVTSLSRLMHEYRFVDSLTPQYLLPAAGSWMAALASTRVLPQHTELAWMWVAAGMAHGGIVSSMLMFRLATRPLSGSGVHCTTHMSVLVATPALASSAAYAMMPLVPAAPLGVLGHVLCVVAWLTTAALLYASSSPGPWANAKFSMLSWQHAFAAAALALSSTQYVAAPDTAGSAVGERLVWLSYAGALLLTAKFLAHTLMGVMMRKWVFVPRVRLSPLSVLTMTYPAMEALCTEVVQGLSSLAAAHSAVAWARRMEAVQHKFALFKVLFSETTHQEHSVVLPTVSGLLGSRVPDVRRSVTIIANEMAVLQQALLHMPQTCNGDELQLREGRALAQAQLEQAELLCVLVQEHNATKDTQVYPVAAKFLSPRTAAHLQRRVWRATPVDRWRYIIPAVLDALSPRAAARYVSAWRMGLEQDVTTVGQIVLEGCTPAMYRDLTAVVPELIPPYCRGYSGGLAD